MEFNVKDFLKRETGSKASTATMVMQPKPASFTPHDYEKVAREGYMKNPYVYTAVNFGGDVFADVDVQLKRRTSDGERIVEDHPLLDLIRRPNEDQGAASFKKELYCFYKLAGHNYMHILSPDTGPNKGTPKQLVNFVPNRLQVVKNEHNGLIKHFKYRDSEQTIPKDEVVYIKDFHPTNKMGGHPSAMSASRAVDVSNQQLEWNLSILQNLGVPAHAFTGFSSYEEAQTFKQNIERETHGSGQAGHDLYLPESVDVDKLGFDTQQMDWINGLKETARIIYSALGPVPSELLNDGENKTYSNVEQAIKAMIFHNTLPAWRIVLDAWNTQLVPKFDDNLFFEVDPDSIASLQESMSEKLDKAVKAYQSELANRGEARGMADLSEDVEDAERTILPSTFIPTDSNVGEDVDEDQLQENGQE